LAPRGCSHFSAMPSNKKVEIERVSVDSSCVHHGFILHELATSSLIWEVTEDRDPENGLLKLDGPRWWCRR